jgi:hypothetical protein
MATKSFSVVRPITHGTTKTEDETDEKRYEPGERIELEDHHAQRLLRIGAIEDLDAAEARRRKPSADNLEDVERQIAELTSRREALIAKKAAAEPAAASPPTVKGKPKG